jgi:hexosaminidase
MVACVSALLCLATGSPDVSVFPKPTSIRQQPGIISFGSIQFRGPKTAANELAYAKSNFISKPGLPIICNLELTNKGSEEGYTLQTSAHSIRIQAATSHGLFYGLQTLRQLVTDQQTLPIVTINDAPRYPWRGFMLDVSRHFFPKADIKHFLDIIAALKLNTFHWHLNDDGGWRLQIRKYPNLTQQGAYRVPADGRFDEYRGMDFPPANAKIASYGGFYTQADVREIVRYATARHINIVPEFELPGHNFAATRSYPWLICSDKLVAPYEKEYGFAFPNVFCAGKESSFRFVENVLNEVMELFPSKVIHIGGDEVDKFLWTRCDDCKQRMVEQHLDPDKPEQLESYFIARVEKYLNAHGRSIIGWDEILEGGLAPNAKVMSWRGTAGGVEAVEKGHEAVMTPWDYCYFDHSNQSLTLQTAFDYDPGAEFADPAERKKILGAQANIWTETLPTRADIESHLMPRAVAMSQSLWSQTREPFESFERRLQRATPRFYALAPKMYFAAPEPELTFVAPDVPVKVNSFAFSERALFATKNGGSPFPITGPLRLTDGDRVELGLRDHQNHWASDRSVVLCGQIVPSTPIETEPGLLAARFNGKFKSVEEFVNQPANAPQVVSDPAQSIEQKDNYGVVFQGFLKITRPGRYTIRDGSDDGSAVWLADQKVLDNDGYHGPAEKTATLELKPGLYPLKIAYFNGTEAAQLKLQIIPPGTHRPEALAGDWLRHAR